MSEIGKLRKVDLREVWPNEASDFTRWLATNLPELGEEVAMDLELRGQSVPAGGFLADILAFDQMRNCNVIIENQLELTDHDHLGKLLTYAASLDAQALIWIAREIRDEHKQAIDWLNQHTDEGLRFFGIEVEALRVGEGPPAPYFRVVASPNFSRKAKIGSPASVVTQRDEAYFRFFEELSAELQERHGFPKGMPYKNTCGFSTGFRGIRYGVAFGGDRTVRVDLYITRGDREENKRIFATLVSAKPAIESEIGQKLQWQELPERDACRIALPRSGSIDDDQKALREIHDWAVDRLAAFKRVFGPRLPDVASKSTLDASRRNQA